MYYTLYIIFYCIFYALHIYLLYPFISFDHNFIQVIWLILNITLSLQTILQNIKNYIWNKFTLLFNNIDFESLYRFYRLSFLACNM